MKHAYLIIAHNEPEVLMSLLAAIDDRRNDIYVHIDRKADFDGQNLKTEKAHLAILDTRIDARWGDFSLVEVELLLMETAMAKGEYDYFHLLSGVDYPIKSQDYIHQYCKANQGIEFIGFSQNVTSKELAWRSQHYFLFSREFQHAAFYKRVLRATYARLQSLVGYYRTKLEVKKGAQWCSITQNFCQFILSHKEELKKNFSHTYCPDELVIQTLCWNTHFKNKVYSLTDEFIGCKRYIPWENGKLRPFSKNDFLKMKNSECWFARKFTKTDIESFRSL